MKRIPDVTTSFILLMTGRKGKLLSGLSNGDPKKKLVTISEIFLVVNRMAESLRNVSGIVDSAYFDYDYDDTTRRDECGLVAIQNMEYISFKGQYEKVPRARKKKRR
jgi:hypothetical protein